jgi:transposase-like protein
MSSVLSDKHFHDEAAAYRLVEARIWPDGPICPHCGGVERIGKMGGRSTRIGTYKCYQCRKPFTVKIGTIFESSHIPLHVWLQAIFLMASSKKGVSSNQLHRTLGVTLKTAWFLSHRLREAMRSGGLDPLGGAGKVVEADETYFGERENFMPSSNRGGRPYTKGGRSGPSNKRAVLALVERGGETRTFHLDRATKSEVVKIVTDNVSQESYLHTDESRLYGDADQLFAEHHTIKHSIGEYVRGSVHTTPSRASSACSSAG